MKNYIYCCLRLNVNKSEKLMITHEIIIQYAFNNVTTILEAQYTQHTKVEHVVNGTEV